jgi:glyoxylase-like metal-dependent hydrolase (beta-lactamase superfamily II)
MPEEYKNSAIEFIEQLKRIQRSEVNLTLKDNDKIEQGLVVINTPGHTKGHISLYIPSEATVIANDAVVIEEDELNIANPAYTLDMDQAINQ